MNRCQFIEDHQRRYGVKRLCRVPGLARSTFYYWRRNDFTATDFPATDVNTKCVGDGASPGSLPSGPRARTTGPTAARPQR